MTRQSRLQSWILFHSKPSFKPIGLAAGPPRRPTGPLYELKSGDSYRKTRRSDGAEVFQIKHPRWADYWPQVYTVMLVIRTSEGEIRWMDVSPYLKRESTAGKTGTQIIFEGERFDAVRVQNWPKSVF